MNCDFLFVYLGLRISYLDSSDHRNNKEYLFNLNQCNISCTISGNGFGKHFSPQHFFLATKLPVTFFLPLIFSSRNFVQHFLRNPLIGEAIYHALCLYFFSSCNFFCRTSRSNVEMEYNVIRNMSVSLVRC